DRLSRVEGLEERKLLPVLVDQLGETAKDTLAVLRRAPRPDAGREHRTCTANGTVDVGRVAGSDVGERLAGRGVDARQGLRADGRDIRAVDERLGPDARERAVERRAHGEPPPVSAGRSRPSPAPAPGRPALRP